MTEHQILLMVQRQMDAKQAQIDGLVAERDVLREQVKVLEIELERLHRIVVDGISPDPADYPVKVP